MLVKINYNSYSSRFKVIHFLKQVYYVIFIEADLLSNVYTCKYCSLLFTSANINKSFSRRINIENSAADRLLLFFLQ